MTVQRIVTSWFAQLVANEADETVFSEDIICAAQKISSKVGQLIVAASTSFISAFVLSKGYHTCSIPYLFDFFSRYNFQYLAGPAG